MLELGIVAGLTRTFLALGPSDLTYVSPKLLSCNFVEPATRVLKPGCLIQTKRPPQGWSFCLYMVEVAGFEPASVNPLPQALHA